MREAQKLQRGQAARPQSRPSPRHKQPPRVRAQGCDRQEKGPKQRRARSGQLARLTEEIRAPGRRLNRCEGGSSDGGGWPPPQQPCSRHLYNAGRVRLPGGHGLDGTSRPGRRRANARWTRGAHSFCSLRNLLWFVLPQPLHALINEICGAYMPLRQDLDATDHWSVWHHHAYFVALVIARMGNTKRRSDLIKRFPAHFSPISQVHTKFMARCAIFGKPAEGTWCYLFIWHVEPFLVAKD